MSVTTFKSRHGFHNCDHDTWLKLKSLRKSLFDAICTKAAWERWNAKHPHNRVRHRKIRDERNRVIGYHHEPEPWPEPVIETPFLRKNRVPVLGTHKMTVDVLHTTIMAVFQSTKPHATPEEVPPLGMTLEQIEALHLATKAAAA